MFTAEFPGDVELVMEESTVEEGRSRVEGVVLRRLMRVASCLIEMGVRFVGCQKVMHPLLKAYWRDKV